MRDRAGVDPSRPASIRRLVDLPQPDGPTRTRNSPSAMSSVRLVDRRAVALRVRARRVVEGDGCHRSLQCAILAAELSTRLLTKSFRMRNAPRTVRALSHYHPQALGEGAIPRNREEGREGSVKTRTSWRLPETAAAILVIAAGGHGALLASSASATSHEHTTLRVDLFGDFGYHDLYKQFEKAHPGVTIKEDIESYADHHSNLAKHLATGAGADDVGRDRGRLHLAVQGAAPVLRRPELLRRLEAEEPVAAVEVGAVDRPQRRADRPRHRCRQHRHLLPPRPDAGGRPAHRAATRCRSSGRPGRRTSRPASSSRRRRRRARSSSTRAATSSTR